MTPRLKPITSIAASTLTSALAAILLLLPHPAFAQSAPAAEPADTSMQSVAPVTPPSAGATTSIRTARYIDRPEVKAFILDLHTRLGIPLGELQAALSSAEPIPRVIDLIKPPADPGQRSWKRYRSRFIEPRRIAAGRHFMQQHAAILAAAETHYGVPKEIIAGIIGVETIYGRNTGSFNTVSALATLAFDYPPRADLFRRELESLLLLSHERGVNALDYKGSFAGAIGLPQFLPSSIRAFAVDFDHDGVIDLRNPADAIGSVASYLAQNGWQRGGRVVLRAQLSASTDPAPLIAAGMQPSLDAKALAKAGATPAHDALLEGETSALIDLVTPDQPTQYWLGLQNFYVITRYNRSTFYAMAVYELGQAIAAPVSLARTSLGRR